MPVAVVVFSQGGGRAVAVEAGQEFIWGRPSPGGPSKGRQVVVVIRLALQSQSGMDKLGVQ